MVTLTPWQAACHSAAVQTRQLGPAKAQVASASAIVTFDQGSFPGTEQARRVESKPLLVAVAS